MLVPIVCDHGAEPVTLVPGAPPSSVVWSPKCVDSKGRARAHYGPKAKPGGPVPPLP